MTYRAELAAAGLYPQADGYYLTPEQAQELMPLPEFVKATVQQGKIKPRECTECGDIYQPKVGNQRYCTPKCSKIAWRRAARERYDHTDTREARRKERDMESRIPEEELDPAFLSEKPWFNLLSAIALQAHKDDDIEARDDMLDIIRRLNG